MKDVSHDGTVDKQEFDQVMKERGDELNQDQINIFNKIFQQDENSKVTYERKFSTFSFNHRIDCFEHLEFIAGATEVYKSLQFH